MSVNERLGARGMQNPGDLRVPEGVVIAPARRVLILEGASLVGMEQYDEVRPLYENGHRPTPEDEEGELKATTVMREPLDKGQTSL
ncbi:MAG: hypothetical protein UX88_C0043G0006 [Candidatus Woesebacteria bacterium GW2011_GWC2_47_16]|uniref:Uncharacterized protein n=6 Tax=Candidatus Woeseibacteriota TaxID=1752722 RepID=A0A1F8D418_9BACT|nr:MAG: hypothetical protein UX34_C0023G0006 [Candidatus Woesebacteria bacterium GW2011_GWF1_46_13]KKU62988.1 MAG: hypothetical protein UX88_C0043G0006 [Candidatus Woesebacteria bacterium GW2011_GWC2_47_16]OGM78572.1 MAG: hypothetical protein A2197_01975 [Candidatus Woesebacteria bacterium RIFOXYA1_FULL_48_16]OGM83333.1 MAG: hypothetical protein A2376_01055 [Candidatus Woesebacteria bacterium RIFOXYB1_FULL_47_31]OGM85130.1 MAG: hypothetical protein A2435_00795 [Candidatus Woesebacteria bacteriu